MSWRIESASDNKGVYVTADGNNSYCPYFANGELDRAESLCNYLNGGDGLTKRERLAMEFVKGSLISRASAGAPVTTPMVMQDALTLADALIAELEKTA